MAKEKVYVYKVDALTNLNPNSIVALKVANQSRFRLFVTDLQGIPYPLEPTGTTAVMGINNTDGNITITGEESKTINLSQYLIDKIETFLQVGDSTSQLINNGQDGINPFITLQDLIDNTTLQSITDNGNITTNNIVVNTGEGNVVTALTSEGVVVISPEDNNSTKIFSATIETKETSGGFENTIQTRNQNPTETATYEQLRPNKSGTYALVEDLVNDKNYVHSQNTAQSTWEVTHNLNKYPSVIVVDSGNNVVIGEISYLSLNIVTISFNSTFSGKVYFN